MINWKVRVRQLWFWLTLIPVLFLLADQVHGLIALAGEIEAGNLYEGPLMALLAKAVTTAFAVMALIGLPVDTTTEGYGDSARALTYKEPAPNASAYGLQEYEEQCVAADSKMADWAADLANVSIESRIPCSQAAENLKKAFGDAVEEREEAADGR